MYLHEIPSPTLLRIIIAIIPIIVMSILSYLKYQTGKSIGSRSLITDSKETLACAFLSTTVLIGLGLNYLFSSWWVDPISSLIIVVFLIEEGYSTLKEED